MSRVADSDISKKITWLYLLALTAVALLLVGGQLLVQQSLKSQLSDSRVINIAGRQRMLSQKIGKAVLLLGRAQDSLQVQPYLAELDSALELWQQCHQGLMSGYLSYIATPVENSETIKAMFAGIDPYFQAIYTNASLVSRFHHGHATAAPAEVDKSIRIVLENEQAYLKEMDHIVFQYDAEAARRVNDSQRIEYILLFCTLGVLLLEGLFIFRPAVHQIQQTIALLVDSERKTQQVNQELVQANQSLKETEEALVQAIDQKYQQEMNEQKIRSAYLVEGQEEERKRVALEIHDGLGQMLTALKFGIEKIGDSLQNNEKGRKNLSELQALVNQTIAEARTISFNLMPAVLSDFGLSSALKQLTAQAAANTGINVTYATNWGGTRLPRNIEVGLYRVGQEAIHNAVKYAGAATIEVELWAKSKYIHLKVTDNGRGFTYNASEEAVLNAGPSHGISNMKERVYMINGLIDILTNPGEGTQIHVKIPNLT
ncbi:type IV pili methyl-accepting chemotaxis transducer N-terminal domain-containing protein [Pontibacter sp. SGAir0037]|uniref:type IV pili methyl-accepting chemotaxis transducer N-terminal domain-containing protein n=1 Tax=Pontibacter sp. SGAir0037 TaxID=2571030 RepID=UPI0010CD567E|nr:type IV pili methyl-accepting chemotaxis transducer N-terminal domain-containing protein [Pontibacter sp. SGAir0037]QCR21383.1 hypothetical protein C1N53_02815 [Pontibacter sp. SGAir0037]